MNTVGIVQEQHPARARLFHQWQEMEWPILVDSANLLGVTVVPIHLLVDRHGVIQAIARDPDQLTGFLAGDLGTPRSAPAAIVPDREGLRAEIEAIRSGDDDRAALLARRLRELGDAEFLWGSPTQAIEAYATSLSAHAADAKAHFRLGVAYLRRDATGDRCEGDFQFAMEQFSRALALDPSNYIWRRRIQQYGPRLEKPYPFYDWVRTASDAVRARGATPVSLDARLTDSERLSPREDAASVAAVPHPDPEGKLPRDEAGWVKIEGAFAPGRLRAGEAARLHVVLRPDRARAVHWNNEVAPLQVWIEAGEGWSLARGTIVAPRPANQIESEEVRAVEFELTASGKLSGDQVVRGYAIYPACEGEGGTCRLLRQEFSFSIEVDGGGGGEGVGRKKE